MLRKQIAAYWTQDKMWHVTEPYEPTEMDRILYPVAFPANDKGPFFMWSEESFVTESEAIEYIKAAQ